MTYLLTGGHLSYSLKGGKGELTHSPTSLPFGRLGVFIRSLRVN